MFSWSMFIHVSYTEVLFLSEAAAVIAFIELEICWRAVFCTEPDDAESWCGVSTTVAIALDASETHVKLVRVAI